jgi:SAM-dependent methyltransferase
MRVFFERCRMRRDMGEAERSTGPMAGETATEAQAARRYFGGFLAACIRFADTHTGLSRDPDQRRRAVPARHAVVASLLERHGVRGKRVADLGCGTGDASIAAARLGATVVGIDQVAGLIAEAARKAEAARLETRARFRVGDITTLPLDHVDVALLVGVIEYYSDLVGLLGRVCAVTGELAIVVDTRGPWWRRSLRRMVRGLVRFTLVYRRPEVVAKVMDAYGFEEAARITGPSFVAMAFRRASCPR